MLGRLFAKRWTKALVVFLFLGLIVISSTLYVNAFQVPPLPDGNLIVNPWFRSFADNSDSSLDGWTDQAGLNKYWSSSQKEPNPSPDIIVTGICGFKQVYCGTAGRLSPIPGQSGGVAVPGVDAYLYQVVSADSSKRKLRFFTHWVSHLVDPAEVNIYGGNSPTGPWTFLWRPLHVVQYQVIKPPEGCTTQCLWEETGWLEYIIPKGYSHYKIEIHANLPANVHPKPVGFKITGIYFAVVDTDGQLPTPSATSLTPPPPTPTKSSTPQPPPGKYKSYIPGVMNTR